MGAFPKIEPYATEWVFKSNENISFRRWVYWRKRGLTPKQINKKFPGKK